MDANKMRLALELSSVNVTKHYEALRKENEEVLKLVYPSQEAINFFTEFSFDDVIEIGAFRYNQANCIKKNYLWDDDFKRVLEANLLLVGSGLNGDMLVLDIHDYQAGLLFHDYFWENEEEDPRKYLIKMGCSLGQFFYNSAAVPDYPIDAYEAAAYVGAEFTGYWNPNAEA